MVHYFDPLIYLTCPFYQVPENSEKKMNKTKFFNLGFEDFSDHFRLTWFMRQKSFEYQCSINKSTKYVIDPKRTLQI